MNCEVSDKMATNGKAWRWAGIHCLSSPEPKLKLLPKLKITTNS